MASVETKTPVATKTFKIYFDPQTVHHTGRFYIEPVLVDASSLEQVVAVVYDVLKAVMNDKKDYCQGCAGCEYRKYDNGCGSTFKPYAATDIYKFCDDNDYDTVEIYELTKEVDVKDLRLISDTVKHSHIYRMHETCVWRFEDAGKALCKEMLPKTTVDGTKS